MLYIRQPKVKINILRRCYLHRNPEQVSTIRLPGAFYILHLTGSNVCKWEPDPIFFANLSNKDMHAATVLQGCQLSLTDIGNSLPLEGIRINISIRVFQILFCTVPLNNRDICVYGSIVDLGPQHYVPRVIEKKLLHLLFAILRPQMESPIGRSIVEVDIIFPKAILQQIPKVVLKDDILPDLMKCKYPVCLLEVAAGKHVVNRMLEGLRVPVLHGYSQLCFCIHHLHLPGMVQELLYDEVFIRTNNGQHL